MGQATGFLEIERQDIDYRPVDERLKDYKDVVQYIGNDQLTQQGARCMDCGIPFCHALGCPVYNLIPEWNDLVYKNRWRDALDRLELTNNLPEVTGRVCPAPCEASCTLSINSAPVTIKNIELAIIETGFRYGWVKPHPPKKETGKRVAVIGSGPAGLAAAQQLRRKGHKVIVFEKSNKIGGLLRYGIPDFKLEKWVLDRRIELMKAEGVEFNTNVTIGEDISARYLKNNFDAMVLTMGAGKPRDLEVPGRDLKGTWFAMDYLTLSNQYVDKQVKYEDIISSEDKTVLVIGGGDTGSDCVGTAKRQGAKEVYQFEIMPKPLEWKESYNPEWPDWPRILRTSSSHKEGCQRRWEILSKEIIGKNGKVESIRFNQVKWEKSPENGRFTMQEVPGTEEELKVDLILLAMGFVHVEHGRLVQDLELQLDSRGNIETKPDYQTSVPGVFSAGDANTGASLVVRAIFHGRQAAESVDQYLK